MNGTADGRIEIYGLWPTPSGESWAPMIHPIVQGVQLTELEQDVEAELRRRGFKFVEPSTRKWTTTPGKWAMEGSKFRFRHEHLNMSVEQIADAIEEEIK